MESKILKEVTFEKLDQIFNFVRHSLYQFEELNVRKEDMRVLMPDSFKYIMQNYYRRPTYFQTAEEQFREAKIFNIEVYPHYKNEIVVYCTKFDLYEGLDQPKIFEL